MSKLTLRDLFAVVTIAAMLVAWWVEHNQRKSIVGVWRFSGAGPAGNRETLSIGRDGTFTKKNERGHSASVTYSGTYAIADDGVVTFHVTSKQVKFHVPSKQVDSDVNKLPAETFNVEAVFRCRCAIDEEGILIVMDLDQLPPGHYRSYTPATPVDIHLFAARCYTPMNGSSTTSQSGSDSKNIRP